MKRYQVLKRTILGFNTAQDQYDAFVEPGEVLESDGHTIWLVTGDERRESITVAHAITIWLANGTIIETVGP